jgi:tight adherence protein B
VLFVFQGTTGVPGPHRNKSDARIRALLDEAGLAHQSSSRFVAACAMCAVVAAFVVATITSSALVGAIFGFAAAWIPVALAKGARARRRGRFREAWPDAITTLVSGVRAGMSLAEACSSLVDRGPDDLRHAFSTFSSTYRATGSLTAGLSRLRTELSDPIADRVVAALAMAHEVGGTDLIRVLRTLGNFVREDLRVRKEIEARWSWTVSAARVAAAAPWIVLLLMSTRPEAAAAYGTPSGISVMVVGAVCTLLGYRLMLRAAKLPEQPRIGS